MSTRVLAGRGIREATSRRASTPGRRSPFCPGSLGIVLLLAAGLLGCESLVPPPPRPPVEPPPAPTPTPTPEPTDPLAVHPEPQPVLVAAWAEPAHLQPGGGQAHILIRVQRRGGAPAEGVEVRLQASKGRLHSGGKILRTDRNGRTRDLLTTTRTTVVTLNAGGTRYSFVVPVLPRDAATPEESSRDRGPLGPPLSASGS